MNKVIEALIAEELARANNLHRARFASMHEGESVIREEIKESREEYTNMKLQFREAWGAVMARKEGKANQKIAKVREYAVAAITELVQVAAMCDKWELSFKEDGRETNEKVS